MFSGESKFNLFGSDKRQYCRRKLGEELLDRNMQKKVKHGGGNLMVWGCITVNRPGRLRRVEGRLTASQYISIVQESFMGTLQDYQIEPQYAVFQQDNDPKHTSKVAQAWFQDYSIKILPWPPNSLDMNIIEHAWDRIDRQLWAHPRQPSNLEELWVALQDEWVQLDVEWIKSLYASLPQCAAALLHAKGEYIKY